MGEINYYLLAWNPKKFTWKEFQDEYTCSVSGHDAQWSIQNHKSIKEGDRFFMIKLGVNPRGLMASGEFTSAPYKDKHWSGDHREAYYSKIKYDFICDPELPVIGIDRLKTTLDQQAWSIQGSSASIKKEILDQLINMWNEALLQSSNILLPLSPQEIHTKILDHLPSEPIPKPLGNKKPKKLKGPITIQIERDLKVVQYTLQQANGVCELCEKPAPFYRTTNNQPYLEVHHIVRLSDGGPDTPDNTVALCPNCHRRIHFGSTRIEDQKFLLDKKSQ